MLKLVEKDIYLAALEEKDCIALYEREEYDFENRYDMLRIGSSADSAKQWFAQIKEDHMQKHIRLGIFLHDGEVIGDIALQDIDWLSRSCTVGQGFARLSDRGKGYGKQALRLILMYGFEHLGLERIGASTLECNIPARKTLEKLGFAMEGIERSTAYINGARHSRVLYGLLKEEYRP